MTSQYFIEFQIEDSKFSMAGFDVCLAIITLDLPLLIVVSVTNNLLIKKLTSLLEYGMAVIYFKNHLTCEQYNKLKASASFQLFF